MDDAATAHRFTGPAPTVALHLHVGTIGMIERGVMDGQYHLGVVPEHRSGRLFRDLLGVVNQRFGAACDEVHLVVAGRVLRL